jgi:hypothetical protein
MRKPIDQVLYFIECDFGKLGRSFVEIDRDRNSRASVIEDIACGEHRDVVTVLQLNPVEGHCRDITAEILGEASFAVAMLAIGEALGFDRVAANFDHVRDLRKHEAVS